MLEKKIINNSFSKVSKFLEILLMIYIYIYIWFILFGLLDTYKY